jgi:hypothetical protein
MITFLLYVIINDTLIELSECKEKGIRKDNIRTMPMGSSKDPTPKK